MYHNPVLNQPAADPFVLKHAGVYWCYATGTSPDGRRFPVFQSRDLVTWQFVAGALAPLPGDASCYWAPEVTEYNGRFYLYYSVGDEAHMQLRVAVATAPAGPFEDSGHVLTSEQFAIDGHVYVAADGVRYLFYATDFLEHSHVGTGTVVARLADWFHLAEPPRPVTRAQFDWQVYDPQRAEKGGVRWHTIEGPFVLRHKGRFYQMFSGGNWQNVSYGVSYAVAERLDTADEWRQVADGETVLPVLRTIPGVVIGPGHNSVVRGPDNQQLFCIYHRWAADQSDRVLCIDPLDWAGERLIVLGPSNAALPAPNPPTFADWFDDERAVDLGVGWATQSGAWSIGAGAAHVAGAGLARCETRTAALVCEVTLRAADSAPGGYGLALLAGDDVLARCLILPEVGQLRAGGRGRAARRAGAARRLRCHCLAPAASHRGRRAGQRGPRCRRAAV